MITHNELLHLAVETASGVGVGKVVGFRFDEESQSIVQYEVKHGVLPGKTLLIHRTQVLSISKEKMIVEDAAPSAPEEEVVCA